MAAKYRQHGYQDRDHESRKGSGEKSGAPPPKKDNSFWPEARQSAGYARGFTLHAVRHGVAGNADERSVSEVRI